MRKNSKAGLIILIVLVMTVTIAGLFDEQAQLMQLAGGAPELPAANTPVYMAGCQAYPKRIPPIVVYKTVRKNFVTLPCALEVPPPGGVLDWQKVRQYQSMYRTEE